MSEFINAENVSIHSLKLMDEHVLVRAAAAEERRASGLWVPNMARESFGRGSEFYGVVVAVGPGRVVERTPPVEAIRNVAIMATLVHAGKEPPKDLAELVGEAVADFVARHTKLERVPMPWKPGDHVMCRQGFGPEIELREGRHHIVGRGNAEHGHGIIAAWDPTHVHCWHATERSLLVKTEAECCGCSETRENLETRFPSCIHPGPRLAEAVIAHEVYSYKIGDDAPPGDYEERPVDDGRTDV